MKDFLLQLIADPTDNSSLQFEKGQNRLVNKGNGREYSIEQDVPVLLPQNKVIKKIEGGNLAMEYQEHYQKDAEVYDYFKEYYSMASIHENKRLHEAIASKVPKGSDVILDIGCGGAWVAQKFLPKGKKVISADISTINPIKALQKFPRPNHAAIVADAFNLPFKPGSIDCIIAAEIMEHVPDPKAFMGSLYKVLKPGGKAIITTPYNEEIEYNLCIHCNKPTPRHAHLHSFSEANIKNYIPEIITNWTYSKANNKQLAKLRTHIVLKFLPYIIWKEVDKAIDSILNKPSRFILEIVKN